MKRIAAVLFILVSTPLFAVDMSVRPQNDSGNQFGVGIGFGGMTGLSMYGDIGREHFLQAGLGFAPGGDFSGTADYAWAYRNTSASFLTPFWGLGAVVLHDEGKRVVEEEVIADNAKTFVGARIPLGINVVIPKTPVQIAGEVAPSLLLTPASHSYVQSGVSVRVLF